MKNPQPALQRQVGDPLEGVPLGGDAHPAPLMGVAPAVGALGGGLEDVGPVGLIEFAHLGQQALGGCLHAALFGQSLGAGQYAVGKVQLFLNALTDHLLVGDVHGNLQPGHPPLPLNQLVL